MIEDGMRAFLILFPLCIGVTIGFILMLKNYQFPAYLVVIIGGGLTILLLGLIGSSPDTIMPDIENADCEKLRSMYDATDDDSDKVFQKYMMDCIVPELKGVRDND